MHTFHKRTPKWLVWFGPMMCLAMTPLCAHDIITTNLTYTRDISRIFAARCQGCHGADSSLPLTTYEEARPWAVSIKEQVVSRAMPPWGAVKGFGELRPDLGLTQEEIMIVAGWVIGGAPKGDPKLLPGTSKVSSQPKLRTTDALVVETHAALEQPLRLVGVKPLPSGKIESTQVTATLPDGRVMPLVWLYRFDPAWKRTFLLRRPLELPAGTVVESSTPLRFVLEGP